MVKQPGKMHIAPVGAIVGPVHLVRENSASDRIYSIWLVNNLVDLNTYWTVHQTYTPGIRCAEGR